MKALLKMETTISQILSNLIEHYSPRLEKRPPNHPGCPLHLPLLPHPLLLPHSPLLPPVPQPASLPTLVQPVKHAGHRGAEVHHRELSSELPLNYSFFHLFSMVFQSDFMVFHGFWLASMVFQGSFMFFWLVSIVFKVVSWFFMVFGWFPWFF